MKVYRSNRYLINHVSELPLYYVNGVWTNQSGGRVSFAPQAHTIIFTGDEFEGVTDDEHFDHIHEDNKMVIEAGHYYIYDGRVQGDTADVWIADWRLATATEVETYEKIEIFNIMEGTYTGKDMGERSITATVEFPSRIDFQIGDYVEFDIANLMRTESIYGGHGIEKFYIYTMPTVKKVASRLSNGKAFQHTVTFYPCQYELAAVKMRDLIQDDGNGVIYTGYDEFSFFGGAHTLMKRIMAVLNERFGTTGVAGRDYWTYFIADAINEDKNTALEQFQFDFSDNSVMDALLKLNESEGINTKFFINERTIYVGYKRPYISGVDENNLLRDIPFEFMYGKTSHLPNSTNHGNLFTITKSNGQASPITRLYAYGSDRNLHRFYCSDRIKSGRYVNKLMLPSFEDDGRTDYIDSAEGIARFGIREGSKTFDKVYPSLRNFYYGNIRDIKYCIKLMGSGLESDADDVYDNGKTYVKSKVAQEQLSEIQKGIDNEDTTIKFIYEGKETSLSLSRANELMNKGKTTVYDSADGNPIYQYPIARIQCYKVVELLDNNDNHTGLNTLVECAPPVDLAVFCHATGKVVKCVLYADKDGQTSIERQLAADGRIPVDENNNAIVGSCFAVHDGHPTESDKHFACGHTHPHIEHPDYHLYCDDRAAWFIDQDQINTTTDGDRDEDKEIFKNQVSIHQINYTDDHWITDVYEFTGYNQQSFNRQGYSAYCWPRINKFYPESQSDNVEVSAVVDVGPVVIEDTDLNRSEGTSQATFDIYLRDVGFKINEQTWFGDRVFLFDTVHINFLDGNLAGYSFEMPGESDQTSLGDIYVPALKPDGTRNDEFFDMADDPMQAERAYQAGAYWRIVAKRCDTEVDNYWMPNINVNAKAGDHIVFLDIFMPDIYIRVAEQRLLKEAKKYLDANDDGDIQYSFDFDKVRPNEQPIFALQMREGAIMRVVDDDLDVGTVNKEKMLFESNDGLTSAQSLLKSDITVTTEYEVVNRDISDIEAVSTITGRAMEYNAITDEYTLVFDVLTQDVGKEFYLDKGIGVYWIFQGGEYTVENAFLITPDNIKSVTHIGSGPTVTQYKLTLKNVKFLGVREGDWNNAPWKVIYSFKQASVTTQVNQSVLPIGVQTFCAANNLTEFQQNKYYEIVMDAIESDLVVEDEQNNRRMFALVNGLGEGEAFLRPEYTLTDITPVGASYKRYKIAFELEQGFNEAIDYYPALLFESDGETEAVHVRLCSILERDNEVLGDINYVDLAIDTVTIKFHDNTREPGVSLQDGQEPERLIDHVTEMTREIQATVKEESRASAWAQLMDRVADAEIVESQTLDFYTTMVNASRRFYNELMALKGSLFDPDGTCNEVFLQIMMLQVGVDSMNYQLKYTHYSITGQQSNCGVTVGSSVVSDSGGKYIDSFFIGNADEVLDHYAFTQNPTGGEGGRWYPDKNKTFKLYAVLDASHEIVSWPTYFIALKASKEYPNDCSWVCETTQHKVNEDDNYFYFNWGILTAGEDGHYTLTETRGNAYMYGDNIICGRISNLAKKSYFDLTTGNFVLSKGDVPALSYINGVLTIGNLNDESGVGKTIKDLGLEVTELENQEIGGENLYGGDDPISLSSSSSGATYTNVTLESGKKYVVTVQDITLSHVACYVNVVVKNGSSYTTIGKITAGKAVVVTGTGQLVGFKAECPAPGQSASVSGIMIQEGNKATSYNAYYQHLTNAIKGTTVVAGGLVMTNVMMLKGKNSQGQDVVTAGMSGQTGTVEEPENVLLWGGGTYAEALYAAINNYLKSSGGGLIQTLLKKDGTGKIGCFRIEDNNNIAVYDANGKKRVIITTQTISQQSIPSTENLGRIDIEELILQTDNDKTISETVSWNGTFQADKTGTVKILFPIGVTTECSVNIDSGYGAPSAIARVQNLTLSLIDLTTSETIATQVITSNHYSSCSCNNTTGGSTSASDLDPATYTANIETTVKGGHNYKLLLSGSAYVNKSGTNASGSYSGHGQASLYISCTTDIEVVYTDMCAYLCADGLCILANSNLRFDVTNNSKQLKILAKGLPNQNSSSLQSGQIWNDNGTLKVKS